MTSAADARERLAELSAGAEGGEWVRGGEVGGGREPGRCSGLARRDVDGYVAEPGLAAIASGAPGEVLRADTRAGLLQTAACFDAATRGELTTGWSHTDERILQAQGTMSGAAVTFVEEESCR